MSDEGITVGWDAVELEMKKLYGEQEPKHYGALIPYMLGGNDPLDGISVYKADKPFRHWHFVTFGFSELYEKESEDNDISGYGFELTFRLIREETEEEPPAWALNLLQNMGRYVFSSGNIFASGDYLDANGPICLGSDTKLTALAFQEDPQLPPIETPNGKVQFLQMIGITDDELEAMKTWNTSGLLEAGKDVLPYWVTDLDRNSLMSNPVIAEAVKQGIESDGSSTGFLYVDQLAWEPGKNRMFSRTPSILTLGAKQAGTLSKLVRGRLLKGKSLTLISGNLQLVLEPGEENQFETNDNQLRLTLNPEASTELSMKLQPVEEAISLSSFKGLMVQVVKTYIKDQDGNVASVIG